MRRFAGLLLILWASLLAGAPPEDHASILGVWRGTMDGLPVIALTVTDEGGRLSVAILFYLIRREEGKPPTSTAGIPEPLLNPKFDGKDLTFQVSHRRAHPPRTLNDPPVSFRLKVTGPDAGALTQAGAPPAENGLPMARAKY